MDISLNTKAILLLAAPLMVGRIDRVGLPPLTSDEYSKFARWLHCNGKQPADLLSPDVQTILDTNGCPIEPQRIVMLLRRGLALGLALEQWQQRNIWVISRADDAYPRRVKEVLKDNAPPLFYGCGDSSLLVATDGVNVIDCSNHTVDRLPTTADAVLRAGSRIIIILTNNLNRAALAVAFRTLIQSGHLLLLSPHDPAAGFTVGNSVLGNRLSAAWISSEMKVTHETAVKATIPEADDLPLFTARRENVQNNLKHPVSPDASKTSEPEYALTIGGTASSAECLLVAVFGILKRELSMPKTDKQIAEMLCITKAQASTWLKTLVERKLVKKLTKPVRYRVALGNEHV